MKEFDYEQLLRKVYEKIPKKVSTAERFRVPQISCEYQGNKTVVKNFSDILSVLRREANHLAKYLFKELATPGSIQNDLLILQAKIPREILQKKLEDYVKAYVYCKVCGEPDTKLVKEERLTFVLCEACGAKRPAK